MGSMAVSVLGTAILTRHGLFQVTGPTAHHFVTPLTDLTPRHALCAQIVSHEPGAIEAQITRDGAA